MGGFKSTSTGLMVVLVSLGLAGCAKHHLGHGSVVVFGLVGLPGDAARYSGWSVDASRSGLLTYFDSKAKVNDTGGFALNRALLPGRYSLSLRKGNLAWKKSITVGRRQGWYQVIELKNGAGLGAVPPVIAGFSVGTVVFGMVTRADGVTPLALASVDAERVSGSRPVWSPKTSAVTNRLGTFVLGERLRPGRYFITARLGVLAPTFWSGVDTVAQAEVAVTPSSGPWVVVRLKMASGSIEGRVLDGSGRPVVGALVEFVESASDRRYASETDGQGRYSISNVIPGTYVADVSRDAAMMERVVPVGSEPVRRDFTLQWQR